MSRWWRLWHLPSLCIVGVRLRRGHGAHCRTEQQADVPRSELSLRRACCESVTAVTAVTECLSDSASRSRRHRPGGASPAPLAPSSGPPRPPSGSRGRAHWEAPTFPLGAFDAPTGSFASSQWEFSKIPLSVPLGTYWGASGSFKVRLEQRVGARGGRLAHPTGTLAFGEAPSPGPTRRREAPSVCSHWEAAPLACARHFLWGTFLVGKY